MHMLCLHGILDSLSIQMSKKKRERQRKEQARLQIPRIGRSSCNELQVRKIKVEADEKLHHRVRRNDICMMMGVSQESSCTVTEIRPARNGTSSFGLNEQPPIKENDGCRLGLDKNVQTDNGSMKVSLGLEEMHERTTTAVQNGDMELDENPNFKKNE